MTIRYVETQVGTALHAGEQALRDAVLRTPFGKPSSAEVIGRDRTGRHFLAVEGDAVLACVGLYPAGETAAKLRHMAVAETRQGEGLGRALLAFALGEVRAGGVRRIETHARCTARGFYARAGFVEQGGEFPEDGVPHVLMWKTL